MIDFIVHEGNEYPQFQAEGNAAQFALPYAKHFCKGRGYDIGCNRTEWSLPGSIPIDVSFEDGYDAFNLPDAGVDYIFSSHCLEHIPNWVDALDYWDSNLKSGGVMFLYLPDYSQTYWRPWNNRKHVNAFTPDIIKGYLVHKNYKHIFVSGIDLNNSFMIVGEK